MSNALRAIKRRNDRSLRSRYKKKRPSWQKYYNWLYSIIHKEKVENKIAEQVEGNEFDMGYAPEDYE